MSLEDKFQPDDGSFLTCFDNTMIHLAGKIGTVYQNVTGRSYKELVKQSYKVASIGIYASVCGFHVEGIPFALLADEYSKRPDFSTPLEEQLKQESKGQNSSACKLLRMTLLLGSPIASIAYFFNLNQVDESSSQEKIYYGMGILLTASLIPYSFASYLSKADIPSPPGEGKFQKIKEKYEYFINQPLGLPLPNVQRMREK